MKIEIINDNIGDKRTFLPYRLSDICPVCGKEETLDLSDNDYLSYPKFGKPMLIRFQHYTNGVASDSCKVWFAEIKIDITITEVSNPRGVK